MNGLAICAGIGGLEIGIKRAIPEYRTVCFIEWQAFAASCLVARMEEKALDQAPIWDDLTTFDGKPWCGHIDLLSAGFPCQPFSRASPERKGIEDERWIFPHIVRIAEETQAPLLFFENVPGIISLGLEHVLRALASLGYDARWCCIAARSVGAPHMRDRFFMLAYTEGVDSIAREHVKRGRYTGDIRWEPEPDISRVDDGTAYRVDRSYCLGNAVVPEQSRLALEILLGGK